MVLIETSEIAFLGGYGSTVPRGSQRPQNRRLKHP